MAYRFDPAGAFDEELRRIAGQQLLAAIKTLEQRPDGLHKAIHEARRKFKRVRAIYRLAVADKEFRKRENARLRDTAASLSAVRDATALIETTVYLRQHAVNARESSAIAKLLERLTDRRDAVAAAESDLEDKVRAAIDNCRTAIANIEAQAFPAGRRKVARLLLKGWKRGLRKAHEALERCRDQPDAGHFHELRKASQNYRMHLSLLLELWPSAMAAKRHMANQLVGLLGHEHDLSILLALLETEPEMTDSEKRRQHVFAVIDRRRAVLQSSSLALANKVFADPADREAAIVELLWLEASDT